MKEVWPNYVLWQTGVGCRVLTWYVQGSPAPKSKCLATPVKEGDVQCQNIYMWLVSIPTCRTLNWQQWTEWPEVYNTSWLTWTDICLHKTARGRWRLFLLFTNFVHNMTIPGQCLPPPPPPPPPPPTVILPTPPPLPRKTECITSFIPV